MCITVGTAAARRDRMMARVEGHLAHPGADGAHSVENRPFDEHLERSPQNLKQIREIHSGEVVAEDEDGPADHR